MDSLADLNTIAFDKTHDLRLQPVAGPVLQAVVVHAGRSSVTLGRGSAADVILEDGGVSRRHAAVGSHGQNWFIWDLGSRHGTSVNGVRLDQADKAPLADGDLISIGPWTFRAGIGQSHSTIASADPDELGLGNVESVSDAELDALAHQRLGLLIQFADTIQSATDELSLADAVLSAAISGTGYTNAALVRPLDDDGGIEVLGYRGQQDETGDHMTFSRSLIRAASRGELVRLTEQETSINTPSHSVIDLGISGAMCAPVVLGQTIAAYLYLDTRGNVDRPRPDAAVFCKAIARLCALALASVKRHQLEARQRQLESDIVAAREAQKMLMPERTGHPSGLSYSLFMEPGRYVAGDLVDVFELPDRRVAVLLGDVAAKGAGAGILMATAEAFLHASLMKTPDVSAAARDVNRYLESRSASNKFVSLWMGVIDPVAGTLEFVDAGHGLWAIRRPDGTAHRPETHAGGMVLGVDANESYPSETIELPKGSRLVVFSDGIVEQPDSSGEQFGLERTLEIISQSTSHEADTERLFEAICVHAESMELADDATIVSVSVPQ